MTNETEDLEDLEMSFTDEEEAEVVRLVSAVGKVLTAEIKSPQVYVGAVLGIIDRSLEALGHLPLPAKVRMWIIHEVAKSIEGLGAHVQVIKPSKDSEEDEVKAH